MARPTKYTPETVKKITDAIKVGATYELACAFGGISHETFSQWRQTKPEFLAAIKEAEGSAAIKWLALIDKAAGEGTWQAAAWKLERRYPESYGRTVVTNQGLTPEKAKELSDADLEAELKKRNLL
jgi:transposase